jgi:hypothetical protein
MTWRRKTRLEDRGKPKENEKAKRKESYVLRKLQRGLNSMAV